MDISKNKITPKCEIHIVDELINQVEKFKNLSSMITSGGKSDNEIKRGISMVKDSFQKLS